MKKLYVSVAAIALLANYANIQATSLLREFENVKSEVVNDIKSTIDVVRSDWDSVIDYLDKSLFHAKTLRAAHASLEQHNEISKTLQSKLSKKGSGKTRSKLSAYKSQADKADGKADTQRKQAKNLVTNLHKQLDKSVNDAKEGHEKTVNTHNEAQQAMAQHDKEQIEKKMKKEQKKKKRSKKQKKESKDKEQDDKKMKQDKKKDENKKDSKDKDKKQDKKKDENKKKLK